MTAASQDPPRRGWIGPLIGVLVLVAAVAVVAVLVTRSDTGPGSSGPSDATCDRTATAPAGSTVETVSQGAQLVVGGVQLGIGALGDDGCSVNVLGDVGWVEVGEQVEVSGVPVMLLSVEPRAGEDDEVGGAYKATFWVGRSG